MFLKTLILFFWMVVLTGGIYPLVITGIAQLIMPYKAQGSLLRNQKGEVIGSLLIGQKFAQERYFWPRPSAVDYNTLPSGGSNLGPISMKLQEEVERRKKRLGEKIPHDLLYASGSGLDPHITPEAAYFQVERIARTRKLSAAKLEALIQESVEEGWLGMPRVNVLHLNLKLDEIGGNFD